MNNIIKKYINCFQNLKADNIHKLLECLSEDVTFIDPFNRIIGKENVGGMLRVMFQKTQNPNFKVIYSLGDTKKKIIKWEFSCIAFKKEIQFFGLSEIEIRRNLIIKHEDFWDSGRNFYCKVPIIGKIFKKIHK